jgi:hypothetical protein
VAEASTEKPGGDLDARADRIRETAKWLILSFAGVGSVLVAGSQLSSLGSLELWSERFLIALGGVAVGLVAVIVAINLVSNVLVQDPLSLRSLADSNDGTVREIRNELESDDSLLPGGSLKTLYTDYREAVRAQASTYKAYRDALDQKEPEPTRVANALASAKAADAYAQTQSAIAQNVVAVARLLNASKAFKKQKVWLVGMTIIGAAGIVTFAAAANPPEDPPPEPAAAPALVRPGNLVRVRLSETGKAVLQERLGADCSTDALRVLALDVSRAGIDVVTLPTSRCAGIRFTLTSLIGTVRSSQR